MSEYERVLQVMGRHPFTKNYSAEEEARLAHICSEVEFQEDDYLIKEDQICDCFYLLVKGLVSVELQVQGGERLRLQTEGNGSTVGWSWLFPPYRGAFDIRALERCKAITVDAVGMRKMMEDDPLFAYRTTLELLETVIDRLSQSRLQLVDIHSAMEPRQ